MATSSNGLRPEPNQLGQQCGFFSPFGEPNEKLLSVVKEANEDASKWHGDATSGTRLKTEGSQAEKPKASVPKTSAEMFAALKLTAEQQAQLEAIDKERQSAEARFRKLTGEAQREARNKFYTERKKKLKTILTDEQWAIWSSFWNRSRNAP